MTNSLKAAGEKIGIEFTDTWYNIAYGEKNTVEDEQKKAFEAFANG